MIRQALAKKGVPMGVAAEEIGISRSWLTKFSLRYTPIAEEWVRPIAEYFGLDPAALEVWSRARGETLELIERYPGRVDSFFRGLRAAREMSAEDLAGALLVEEDVVTMDSREVAVETPLGEALDGGGEIDGRDD